MCAMKSFALSKDGRKQTRSGKGARRVGKGGAPRGDPSPLGSSAFGQPLLLPAPPRFARVRTRPQGSVRARLCSCTGRVDTRHETKRRNAEPRADGQRHEGARSEGRRARARERAWTEGEGGSDLVRRAGRRPVGALVAAADFSSLSFPSDCPFERDASCFSCERPSRLLRCFYTNEMPHPSSHASSSLLPSEAAPGRAALRRDHRQYHSYDKHHHYEHDQQQWYAQCITNDVVWY